ncbi:MAG: serine/threonine-protein kinase, partial [Myxococcales bacterium]|nr:serine/threonine-protein kinase [Myxococcales bacterium]
MKDGGTAARQFDGPDRIGPYQLLAKLAEGGMGTVYLARMTGPAGFTKLAVVKQLKEDLLGSRRFAELFLDEARLAARLTHPNVVHTYGAGEDDGHLYLAMEYLDGQPWSRVQRRLRAAHALPLKAQLKVLTDTLNGLHYAHELKGFDGKPFNVVHCDISPQNVFVTYDGQVKVVDFGVARAAHNKRDTGESVFLGKVGYCAPEQARGEAVDRRADIFSVGVMLFEALTGERFSVGEGAVKTLRNRGLGKEPRIRDMAPDVPDALAHICDRALALSADERYPTAAEFRAELVECMAQSGQEFEP